MQRKNNKGHAQSKGKKFDKVSIKAKSNSRKVTRKKEFNSKASTCINHTLVRKLPLSSVRNTMKSKVNMRRSGKKTTKGELTQQLKSTQRAIEINKVCINEEPQSNAQVMPSVEHENYTSNMYRGVKQLDSQISPICSSSHSQRHYYAIQEVNCRMHEENLLIQLRDKEVFDNFEEARDCFIQNYFEKIKNGCKPARTFSYPSLCNAIEASKNSIYGFWVRVIEPKNGYCEIFLRRKQMIILM